MLKALSVLTKGSFNFWHVDDDDGGGDDEDGGDDDDGVDYHDDGAPMHEAVGNLLKALSMLTQGSFKFQHQVVTHCVEVAQLFKLLPRLVAALPHMLWCGFFFFKADHHVEEQMSCRIS